MTGPPLRRSDLPFQLLAIGSRSQATPAAAREAAAAGGAALALLLRQPTLTASEIGRWVEAVLPACREAGALLLVHGVPELARLTGADGVHLPERRCPREARSIVGPRLLVGASCHDAAGVRSAAERGADYVTLSPVFPSPGKGEPLGLAALAETCRNAPVPVVALGGIVPDRVAGCRAAGAAAVAAIRAVWEGEVTDNVRRLLREARGRDR